MEAAKGTDCKSIKDNGHNTSQDFDAFENVNHRAAKQPQSISNSDRRALRPKSARYGCRPSSMILYDELNDAPVANKSVGSKLKQEHSPSGSSTAEAKLVQTENLEDSLVRSLKMTDSPTDNLPRKSSYKNRSQHNNRSASGIPRRQKSVEFSGNMMKSNVANTGYVSPEDDLPIFQHRRHEETPHVPYEVVLNASSQKVLDKLKDRQRALSGVSAGKPAAASDNATSMHYSPGKLHPLYSSRLNYRQK